MCVLCVTCDTCHTMIQMNGRIRRTPTTTTIEPMPPPPPPPPPLPPPPLPPHTALCPCSHIQAMRRAHLLDGAVPSSQAPPPPSEQRAGSKQHPFYWAHGGVEGGADRPWQPPFFPARTLQAHNRAFRPPQPTCSNEPACACHGFFVKMASIPPRKKRGYSRDPAPTPALMARY